jgi:hypothetical protein
MAKFKQEQIIAGVTKTRSNALKVYCASAIAANDIIVATGMQGDFMSVEPADPGSISKCRGPFFVADYAAAAGEYTALALPYKVVTGVDTSAAAQVGDAVYLSTVAGSEGGVVLGAVPAATADGAAFSLNVRVGRITKVHASLGSYVLSPGDANSTPMIGKVTCSGTSSTVTGFTAELDGAPVVVSMDANIATTGAVIASGTLTIHHASSTDDATYVIYA